jgi:hypothetical protein
MPTGGGNRLAPVAESFHLNYLCRNAYLRSFAGVSNRSEKWPTIPAW